MAQKYRKEKIKVNQSAKIERPPVSPTSETASPNQTTLATSLPPLPIQGGEQNQTPGGEQNQGRLLPAHATLQQQRAHFALTWIQKLVSEWSADTEKQKKFNSYASAMPFMIHTNGLGQTAAFYRCKGEKDVHYQLYQLVGAWLSQDLQPFAGKPDLLDGITHSELDHYLAAQAEAMQLLDWVKKLANAFMAVE